MNKIIIALCALIASFAAQAAIPYHDTTIVVTQKSGVKSEFKFSDEPVMTFDGDEVTIVIQAINEPESRLTLAVSEVEDITFVALPSGVQTVGKESPVRFTTDRNGLYAENLQPGAEVVVAGIDGRVAASVKADFDGRATVSIEELQAGVYVVYAQGVSFKFIK